MVDLQKIARRELKNGRLASAVRLMKEGKGQFITRYVGKLNEWRHQDGIAQGKFEKGIK